MFWKKIYIFIQFLLFCIHTQWCLSWKTWLCISTLISMDYEWGAIHSIWWKLQVLNVNIVCEKCFVDFHQSSYSGFFFLPRVDFHLAPCFVFLNNTWHLDGRLAQIRQRKVLNSPRSTSLVFTGYSWLPPSRCDYSKASERLMTCLAHANPAPLL